MFFLIEDPIKTIGQNAPNSDCFFVETAFNYLQQAKRSDFKTASGQESLRYVSAPTTWIYFARRDNDDIHKADGYVWRDRNTGKKYDHVFRRYYIYLPNITSDLTSVDQLSANAVNDADSANKDVVKLKRKESTAFQKYVYHLTKEINQSDPILIAYRRDDNVFV